jgi:TRAP-type uncharacterized transport system substrate-binding protein
MRAISSGAGGLLLLVAVLSTSSAQGQTQEPGLFTIGTAARGGVYHPVGNAICRFVNAERERHGLRCLVAPSVGSVANIEALRSGEWAYVIVQSDVQEKALCQNEIDVATFVVGHPSGWIQDIKNACDARVVPVTGPAIDALLKASPFYAPPPRCRPRCMTTTRRTCPPWGYERFS